jgi:hypothetical protein
MAHAEHALRALRLGAELDAARLACALQQSAERLGAAVRREARLADRHKDWCDAVRACLAAVPIDPPPAPGPPRSHSCGSSANTEGV